MLGRQPTGGLTARVGWLGLKVGGQLALPCIRQMNRVNSRSDFHDDSSINIVRVLLLLLLLLKPRSHRVNAPKNQTNLISTRRDATTRDAFGVNAHYL